MFNKVTVYLLGVLLITTSFLLLTGCSKKEDLSNAISVKSSRWGKATFEKVCIDNFVYLYNGYTLTPKIKYQDVYGPIIERCGE